MVPLDSSLPTLIPACHLIPALVQSLTPLALKLRKTVKKLKFSITSSTVSIPKTTVFLLSPAFNPRTNKIISTPVFSVDDVRRVLTESKNSFTCGPDGCPPIFLKKFPELSLPLCNLFNMSIAQGCVPLAWKTATVIPIYKGKGSLLDVKNYRPISLTNVYCNALEKLIRDRILLHLDSENLLSPAQSGFRFAHSTLTQLTHAQSFINNNINNLLCVDGVYTDLSKAFDTISHVKLLSKLHAYGIQGSLLDWIKSFHANRSQSVSINSALSSSKPCISGAPQGCILSPLFFLIFINDLPDCISHSSIYLYADDAKLLKSISNPLDCLLLQEDLNAVASWCSSWQLSLNISKCLYIRFGLANKPPFNYSLSGTVLSQVHNVSDLGVLFDSKLNFSAHCHKTAAEGFSRATLLLKCFYSNDRTLQCKLFSTFVRPLLEYNSPIWSPHFSKDILALEKVQKYFTKNLKGLKNKSYKERLAILNIPSLECRRAYNDLVYLYKIIHGLCDSRLSSLFLHSDLSSHSTLRRHCFQLSLPKPRTDLIKYSFCYRSTKLWNSLPTHIANSPSISHFKPLIYRYLCDLYKNS